MGYAIYGGGSMRIKKENFEAVNRALLAKWPDLKQTYECTDPFCLLAACGFDEFDCDGEGNLAHLYICDRKLWDQAETLEAISPYVEEARLEMTGEDSEKWLWAIKDHEFYECNAIIRYDGDPFEKEERL